MLITFDLALFKNAPAHVGSAGLDRRGSERALLWLLESFVNINRIILRENNIPPLYKAGVVYRREERTEIWKDASRVLRDGFGDCEDLSAWRVAELRNNGKEATPYIRYRMEEGRYIYHVMVMRHGEALEDPSRILGMQ